MLSETFQQLVRPALIGVALAIGSAVLAPGATAQQAIIGEIRAVAFSFCPRDWLEASGQQLPIRENEALFSLLGTTYGGDGRTTFALPDLNRDGRKKGNQRDVRKLRYCIAVAGFYPTRP